MIMQHDGIYGIHKKVKYVVWFRIERKNLFQLESLILQWDSFRNNNGLKQGGNETLQFPIDLLKLYFNMLMPKQVEKGKMKLIGPITQ